ncbi:MAG: tetratricopeptide repeat protein [Burkholderiaceae bacterium]
MAQQLRVAKISPLRAVRSFRQLKATLPGGVHLSALRIQAIGREVAARAGGAYWETPSGQIFLDFDAGQRRSASLVTLDGVAPREADGMSAEEWFRQGEQAEGTDRLKAAFAYRQAIALKPDQADAYINLGAMLCEESRCAEALQVFDAALAIVPQSALLHYNRAIALEDQCQFLNALKAYERCIELDPVFADAHFNAARICEKLTLQQATLRHFSAYKRLQP